MLEKFILYLIASCPSHRKAVVFSAMAILSFAIAFIIGAVFLPTLKIAFYTAIACGLINGYAIMLGVENEMKD